MCFNSVGTLRIQRFRWCAIAPCLFSFGLVRLWIILSRAKIKKNW